MHYEDLVHLLEPMLKPRVPPVEDVQVGPSPHIHIKLGCFPECVARVPVSFGGLGVRLCSRKVVSMSATVRNRLRVRRKALHSGECTWSDPESV